jgi:NADH dehydrogenase
MSNLSAVTRRHRVVIIGSGFPGQRAAQALKRADAVITLISRTTTHLPVSTGGPTP